MEPTLIFECVYGSRAFGLDREGSDLDLRGIVVGPRAWYLGPRAAPEQLDLGKDHVHFEIRRFLRLAEVANPSVLEMLFTDPGDHRVVSPAGARLLAARDVFVTSSVAETFGNYAFGQLRRIESHRRWLLDPPRGEPSRAAFGLPEHTVIPKDQLGAAEALLEGGRLEEADVSSNFLELLGRERRYRAARTEFANYRRWLEARNPARAALEARHGYDTKHAMHLVRLLRMAVEILETGEVRVRRTDRDELLAVRDGAWSYETLIGFVEPMRARVVGARASTRLPDRVDPRFVDDLCVSLVEEVLAC